ncbi:MAG: hypothetical protein FWE32_03645 [Oscillospiraceae bacterium]|nr:hypothetical protein [Oscillospiraceae bacterium]
MNDVDKMLVKQFLLRVRQGGFTIVENIPHSISGLNIDIYRGKTKICTFDDRQLGERWKLRVHTEDSTRPEIKQDFYKLFYTFIHLRDLYAIYEAATPLQGYDHSLGYRAIMQHDNCVFAVKGGNRLGEIEFGTFKIGINSNSYGSSKTIRDNIYFDMDAYPLAKLDFVTRSGLLPKEQLITPDNIKYLRGSCEKVMAREGNLFDADTKTALGKVITDLEKADDSFRDVEYKISAIPVPNAQYIDAQIFGAKGILTGQQIDRATLPKGLFAYDVQYSSDEMKPDKLWNSVIGRRFGTVITKKPLAIGEKGYTGLNESDLALNPEKHPTLKEFQSKNRAQER